MSPEADTLEVSRRIGVDFADLSILERALTHPSWAVEHSEQDYQRLEFLGDSVLGLLVSQMLFRRFPDLPEGDLTRMKNALVRGAVLAEVCDDLGLTEAIRLGEGSQRTGVRARTSVREAIFEAVVAAVYLDAGFDAADAFVTRALGDRVDSRALTAAEDDPKTRLQEAAQAQGLGLPSYRVVERTGPPHEPTFTCEASVGPVAETGSGPSKQTAEQAAASAVLAEVESRGA